MMSNFALPEGWIKAKISEISIKGEQRKPTFGERFDYIDIGSIDRDLKAISEPQSVMGEDAPSRARKVVKTGDVLVSLTRPNLNAVALIDEKHNDQIASTGFEVVRPIALDSRYVFALVRSKKFIDEISGAVQGALYPAAKSSDVQKFEFPLPPLAEQKLIADKLDSLLAQVDSTKARLERIPEILKRFRQSVLAAAVSGRLTEEWRLIEAEEICSPQAYLEHLEKLRREALFEESVRVDKKFKYKPAHMNILEAPGDLPKNWQWIPVEALAYKVTDGVHKKPRYVDDGVPFVTVKNMTKGRGVSFEEVNFISQDDHEEFSKRTNPEKGDILISKDGTLGVVRQIRTDVKFSIFVSVALVKPVDRSMVDYLELAFNAPIVQAQMLGVGTGLQHIHLTDLRKDLIPVPPGQEQNEIVRRVDQLFAYADNVERQVNSALERVNQLTQSILAKAFRGELTAQWREDNPELINGENSAEALLERIKEARAAQAPKKRTKKKASA